MSRFRTRRPPKNSLVRLTDIQLVLLATAAQRDNGSLLPPPETLGDGPARIRKAVESLIRRGLAQEVTIKKSPDAWRTEGLRTIGVVITDAGRAAIGVEGDEPEVERAGEADGPATDLAAAAPETIAPAPERPTAAPAPNPAPAAIAPPAAQTKTALVLDMLRRESGATLDELTGATSWLPHTTRAALTGLRKKGHAIDKRKRGAATCYQSGGTSLMRGVAVRVAEIEAMKPTALKVEWERVHGEQPPSIAASLLARALAFDLQCAAQGGAGEKMRQRLSGARVARAAPAAVLAPGTQLVREWGGESHHVLVEEKGRCSYREASFASLSAVARHITGAHWSGPRFFGIKP